MATEARGVPTLSGMGQPSLAPALRSGKQVQAAESRPRESPCPLSEAANHQLWTYGLPYRTR